MSRSFCALDTRLVQYIGHVSEYLDKIKYWIEVNNFVENDQFFGKLEHLVFLCQTLNFKG